jgi:hypothetical protein
MIANFNIKYYYCIIVVFVVIFNNNIANCETKKISIEIDDTFVDLNKLVYGFNQNFINKNSDVGKLFNSNVFDELKPNTLRFPGGAISNAYNWEDDHLSFNWNNGKKNSYIGHTISAFDPSGKKIGFEQYINFYKKIKSTPVFVVNQKNRENKYGGIVKKLQFAKDNGIDIKYIEIGNECYFDQFKNPNFFNEYYRDASKLISTIRKNFPNVKIGLPIGGYKYWKKSKKWDDLISKCDLDYDAVVFHAYATSKKKSSEYLDSDEYKYINGKFLKTMNLIKRRFKNKKIWITEWNIWDRPLLKKNRTLIGTLYTADFFLKLIRDDTIEIATYHRIFGGTHSIINLSWKMDPIITKKEYPYYLWKTIKTIFDENDQTATIKCLNHKCKDEFEGQIFTSSEYKTFMFINRSKNTLIISDPINKISNVYGMENKDYLTDKIVKHDKQKWNGVLSPLSITFVRAKK